MSYPIAPIQAAQPTQPIELKGLADYFLRAYVNALKPHLTADDNLSQSGTAIFVSTNLMRGVPIKAQPEFVNTRVFALADAIQDGKSPIWSASGSQSFVSFLKEYTDSVQDTTKPEYAKLKAAEEKYRSAKREASMQLEIATYRYRDFTAHDQTRSFDDYLKTHGFEYTDAKEERDAAKIYLQDVQLSGGGDVRRARKLLASAMDDKVGTSGSSMLCATTDITDAGLKRFETIPETVIYRPLHVLEGWDWAGDIWSSAGLGDKNMLTQIKISLEDGFDVSWAELGFPNLDLVDITAQKSAFSSLSSEGKEAVRSVLESWDMTLNFTALHPFDVSRGLWNIEGFRTILPELASSAPAYLRAPILKTTRLLLAYNADLVLKLPQETFRILYPGDSDIAQPGKLEWPANVLMSNLMRIYPFARVGNVDNPDEPELHVRRERNELYPALLGVLTKRV